MKTLIERNIPKDLAFKDSKYVQYAWQYVADHIIRSLNRYI